MTTIPKVRHTHLPVEAPETNAGRFFFWQVTMLAGGEIECLDHGWPPSAEAQREAINAKLVALTTMTGKRPAPQPRLSRALWERHRQSVEEQLGIAVADQSPVPPLVARTESLGVTFELTAVDPDPEFAVLPNDDEPESVVGPDGILHDHPPVPPEPDAPYAWKVYHAHPPEAPDEAADIYCLEHGFARAPDAQNDAVGAVRRNLQSVARLAGVDLATVDDLGDLWAHVRTYHHPPVESRAASQDTEAPPAMWRLGPMACGGYLILIATAVRE